MGGRQDAGKAFNGVFDVFDIEAQVEKDRETYKLTEAEAIALRAAYLEKKKSALERAGENAAIWIIEQWSGVKPTRQRSTDEILNEAKKRMNNK